MGTLGEGSPGRPAVLLREAFYRRSLAVADVVGGALALGLTVTVGDGAIRPATLVLPLVIVLIAKLYGLYDRDELLVRKTTLDEAPALFQAATLYALVFWLTHESWMVGPLSHPQLTMLWALLFALPLGLRVLARASARRMTPAERCLLVGDDDAHAQLEPKLAAEAGGSVLVGHVSWGPENSGSPTGPPSREDMERLVTKHDAHRVIVAPGRIGSDEMLEVIGAVKECGVRVSVLPRLFEVVGSSVEFDRLDGLTLLGVHRFGLSRSSRLIKRALDMVAASLGLVILAPLLLVLAAMIKTDSRGPLLFRQTRVGRDGKRFQMIKFRTMVAGADAQRAELEALNETDGLFKIAEDPRMTRVGRMLRRSSLDELPQLWNVMRGEMSLVGPRPLIEIEDQRVAGRHRRRLKLKPGMTGQWQVIGSSRVPLQEMLTIDYLYAANWSLWLDLKILARTVPHVVARKGL